MPPPLTLYHLLPSSNGTSVQTLASGWYRASRGQFRVLASSPTLEECIGSGSSDLVTPLLKTYQGVMEATDYSPSQFPHLAGASLNYISQPPLQLAITMC